MIGDRGQVQFNPMQRWHFLSMQFNINPFILPRVFLPDVPNRCLWLLRWYRPCMFLFQTFIWNRPDLEVLTACKVHPYHHFWAGIQFFLRKGEVWDELTARRETREVQPQSNTHMPKRTPNSLSLHTVWLHDLRALPSRGWFYFPAFNGPFAPGAHAPLRWRKRETRFFWPLNTSKGSGCPGFLFFSPLMEQGSWAGSMLVWCH